MGNVWQGGGGGRGCLRPRWQGDGGGRSGNGRRGRQQRPWRQCVGTDQPGGDAGPVDELRALTQLAFGAVLSLYIVDKLSANGKDGAICIRPNPATRFFTDNVQHGLCIYLGLAELLRLDLERGMKTILYVVQWLQCWVKKEFVLPYHGGNNKDGNPRRLIISFARDSAEMSTPQAFGVLSVWEFKQFLRLDAGQVDELRALTQLASWHHPLPLHH
jgi:hypothetical protein